MLIGEVKKMEALERAKLTRQVTLIGAATNLTLSIIQIIIGIWGNSQALVADAMHTFSDLLSDGLAYWTARHSGAAPDSDHPYGHARFETVATLGIAAILTLVGIGIAWFAIERASHATDFIIPDPLTLYIAAITIFAKEGLYHYTVHVARFIQSDMLRANAWHHRSDAISSIIVFIGVAGTLLGWQYLDSLAAIVVSLMIINIGTELGKNAIKELVDTGLSPTRIQDIRATILAVGGVRDLHLLRTRRFGHTAMADVHVLVEPYISVSEGHQIGLEVEQRLKQVIAELSDVVVHIDPEDDETDASCAGLPLRAEVLRRLDIAWQHIPIAHSYSQIVLHYLGGRVNIDVYFPFNVITTNCDQVATINHSLQQALREYTEFNTVKIYLV